MNGVAAVEWSDLRAFLAIAREGTLGGAAREARVEKAMIGTSSLGKSFGDRTLFEDVSLQLNTASRYGLVGANGRRHQVQQQARGQYRQTRTGVHGLKSLPGKFD